MSTLCCISSGSSRRSSGGAGRPRSSSSSSRCSSTRSSARCTATRSTASPAVDVLLAGLFGYGAANTAFGGLAIMLVVPARGGRAQAAARDAAAACRLPRRRAALDARDVRAAVGRACSRSAASAFDASMPANWLGFAGAIVLGVASLRRTRTCGGGAHPLGGGRLGRRQRRRSSRWRSSRARSGRRRTSRPSCRRSPTCYRSRTSSTSSTASTSTATRSSPIRKRSRSCSRGALAGVVVALAALRLDAPRALSASGCRASRGSTGARRPRRERRRRTSRRRPSGRLHARSASFEATSPRSLSCRFARRRGVELDRQRDELEENGNARRARSRRR